MNPIALALDVLLAGLLLLALMVGVRLNGRLKALRDSHLGFALAVTDLDVAALRAESALAALREASEDTHDSLLARIETARALATRLEALAVEAKAAEADPATVPAMRKTNDRAATSPDRAEARRVSPARSSDPCNPSEVVAPRTEGARSALRRRPTPEDELFEDGAERRPSGDSADLVSISLGGRR